MRMHTLIENMNANKWQQRQHAMHAFQTRTERLQQTSNVHQKKKTLKDNKKHRNTSCKKKKRRTGRIEQIERGERPVRARHTQVLFGRRNNEPNRKKKKLKIRKQKEQRTGGPIGKLGLGLRTVR